MPWRNARNYRKLLGFSPLLLFFYFPAFAQLAPSEPDPLTRIRDAAKNNAVACSATGETLCEQVAPKIIANAQGDSPLAENLQRLASDLHRTKQSTPEVATRVVAMFRSAGVEAHVEENPVPTDGEAQDAVVAELRGREKPEEWVLVGADVDLERGEWIRLACNVSLVVEAARDIHLTGIKPRRSIRFVILINSDRDYLRLRLGAWPYVRAHRDELDRARAVLYFPGGADRIGLYELHGRKDIETSLREAIKPLDSWKIPFYVDGQVSTYAEDFDFWLEGVPTIDANQHSTHPLKETADFREELNRVDVQELKRNTAAAAVSAFGIAERAEPIGPRQSRDQVEILLKSSIGVGGIRPDDQMKAAGIWPLWESGQRGRQP